MLRDRVILGGFIGVLGKIAMDIVQIPLWLMKVVEHPLAHYAGSLFLDLDATHHSAIVDVVSFLADYVYGIFLGIVFVYYIYLMGKRHLILKGLLFGAFVWLFSFGGLRSLSIVRLRQVLPANVPYYFFIHMVFGLALGFFTRICTERYRTEHNE